MNETRKYGAAIQAIKAVTVLLVISIVCVLLLSIFNDVFYISDEERARRAEIKINQSLVEVYPDFVQDTSFDGKLNSQFSSHSTYGTVSKVVKSTDGTFIVAASDWGVGWGGAPLTVLVAISKEAKIVAWKISDGGSETQLDNLKGVNESWYIGTEITASFAEQKVAGTTKSSDAVYNAIQMACYYAINALPLNAKNPEADAKDAAMAVLAANGVSGVELATVAGVLTTTVSGGQTVADYLSDGSDTISYVFSGVDGANQVYAYVYGTESHKVIVVDGNSVYTSNNVTASDTIYNKAVAFRYVSVEFAGATFNVAIVETDTTTAQGATVYTVLGYSTRGYDPGNYTLKVTVANVGGVGTVQNIEVVVSGYAPYNQPESEANVLANGGLVGATLANIDSLYNANKVSGVSQSANIITAAVKAVLAQFDAGIAARA